MAITLPDISPAELRAVVRAVRAHPRRDKDLRAAVAMFAVFLAIFLHSATPAAWNPSPAHSSAHEENQMLSPRQIAVVSSLALSSAAVAQNAVQWRVEDGGNGHWYTVVGTPQSWQAARSASESVGGHLLSIGSEAEAVFLRAVWSDACWIGLFQDRTASNYFEPTGGWRWVTGEELTFTHWRINTNGQPNEPNNLGGGEDWAHIDGFATTWNDASSALLPFAVEWSADCNADGIVDYGQIRAGELADANANNIPDCCESGASCDPCPADVDGSGAVNGVDLAAILNVWGTSGGKYPRADINHDGIVNGPDLSEVLSAWGPCH